MVYNELAEKDIKRSFSFTMILEFAIGLAPFHSIVEILLRVFHPQVIDIGELLLQHFFHRLNFFKGDIGI